MQLMKRGKRGGHIHIQRSAGIPLCGYLLQDPIAISSSEEPTCKRCLKIHKQITEVVQEKTCTVCGKLKSIDEFYYNAATDSLLSKCIPCHKVYTVMARKHRQLGLPKLSTKEFREKRLYETASSH